MRYLLASAILSVCIGCGEALESARESARSSSNVDSRLALAREDSDGQSDESSGVPTAENRKIIYTATLSIVVEDFSGVEQAISDLVKSHGGFIASANVALHKGKARSGSWIVRVPVDSFEQFLDATGNLGVPERREQDGQDVTEECVDLEARISSKQKLEQRILELLEDNKGEIKDVIEVERELSRVRTEIEQMEGRLRYLADRTELTTVTIRIREDRSYVPPQAPNLSSRIASTWSASANALAVFGQQLVILGVACAPWLLVVGVVAGPVWAWRRSRRNTAK